MDTLKRFVYRDNDFSALQNLGFKSNYIFIFTNYITLLSLKVWIHYGKYERHNLYYNVPVIKWLLKNTKFMGHTVGIAIFMILTS